MASDVVSVLAAAASVAAAGVAALGAARASHRADGIDRRRHMVEAHDARVASFAAAHRGFMEALAEAGHGSNHMERAGSLGPVVSRCDLLVTHPLATEQLSDAAMDAANGLTQVFGASNRSAIPDVQASMDKLRAAVRDVYAAADLERTRLLGELTAPSWWRRGRT